MLFRVFPMFGRVTLVGANRGSFGSPPSFVVAVIVMLLIMTSIGVGGKASDLREPARYVVGFHTLPPGFKPGDTYHEGVVRSTNMAIGFGVIETTRPKEFYQAVQADSNVRYVEEDALLPLVQTIPLDFYFFFQYGPRQIRAPGAWDTTFGNTTASVCIVDTGIRYTHEDLAGTRWLGGFDFVNSDFDPWDDHGHGTHVAGIAAASINNIAGIAGVGHVGLFGVKVLNAAGSGTWSNVANGITWCADNAGTRTAINLSLGGASFSQAVQDAAAYAYAQGFLLVAAAGNAGPCTNCILYPARLVEVIAVTCTNSSETQCGFSSNGPESELAAPGSGILSTCVDADDAYCSKSGTSMSTPHVSGAAAIAWGHLTNLTNVQLREWLQQTAQELGPLGWDEFYGYGEVDAKCLMEGTAPCA